jgi:hypothetical protein
MACQKTQKDYTGPEKPTSPKKVKKKISFMPILDKERPKKLQLKTSLPLLKRQPSQTVSSTPSLAQVDIGLSEKQFRSLDHFRWTNRQKLHPYDDDAPYMQSYDPMLLEKYVSSLLLATHTLPHLTLSTLIDSDRQTNVLLRMINATGSPAFQFLNAEPQKVLDLGCGPGYWVLEAAAAWKSSRIVGLDLVDVFSDDWKEDKSAYPNVEFVRSNLCVLSLF